MGNVAVRSKHAWIIALCLVLPGACDQDQSGKDVSANIGQLQTQALHSDLAWSLLQALTTEVGPRMAGSGGDPRAVEWAKTLMESMGFDRVWTEPVSFPRWRRGAESAYLSTGYRLPLAVTALGGSPGTGGLLQGDVVHFPDLQALIDAPPGQVRGKIVFISARMEPARDGSDYGRVVAGRKEGPYVAAEKGALALIIRSVGTDHNRLAHTGMMAKDKGRAAVPSAAISNPDADLLESIIESGRPVHLELNLDCGFDGAASSYNVIGEITGSDPDAGYFMLGAHLDSWDLGTGAIDDGAGVAIVIAAAKMIADLPQRTHRGLRVVLFANEEQGIYGGREYARMHKHELDMHIAGAESDLGSGRVYRLAAAVSEQARSAIDELARNLSALGISYDASLAATGGADVGQMRALGMPVIDLKQDASAYFDVHHTANDTLDKVDPDDLRQNVAAWVTLAWFMAESNVSFGPIAISKAED